MSHTALKSASFVVRPSRSCRDATQITTRWGAQTAISSTGESELPGGSDVDEHSADYVSSAHLEDSDPYPRQLRRGNPADGDELPCAVEHSAECVSCKAANLIL